MIYCVEDDRNIRELIVYTLIRTGVQAQGFPDGESFFAALHASVEMPSLVFLDIMLPGNNGIDILKQLKDQPATKNIPVILLTAKGTEYDKVIGLDSGADDYVTKPFGMMELMSRMKAVLRRSGVETELNEVYKCGAITLETRSREVRIDGKLIHLTFKEYELLKCLLQNRIGVVSREKLLRDIWGYEFVGESRTVDVHVRTLRQKLGSAGACVQTVRGVGYRIGENYEK